MMMFVIVCLAVLLQIGCAEVFVGTPVSEKKTSKSLSNYWYGQEKNIREEVFPATQSYVTKALANVASQFNYLRGGVHDESTATTYGTTTAGKSGTCPAGQYCNVYLDPYGTKYYYCENCPLNTFNPGYTPQGGWHQVNQDVYTTCWYCASGTYTSGVGASACLVCPPGCTCIVDYGNFRGGTSPSCPSPTTAPTTIPTPTPTKATMKPTTASPTYTPTTASPTCMPTFAPSFAPTAKPTSAAPTLEPSKRPTYVPTTSKPTAIPTTAIPPSIPKAIQTTAIPSFRPSTASPSFTAVPTLIQQTINNLAGTGKSSNAGDFAGDGGPATSATFCEPTGIAVDSSFNAYIVDNCNNKVRVVNKATGTITTYAGNGQQGSTGDSGKAISAKLNYPYGVAIDPTNNNLFIADQGNCKIRMVTQSIITTYAGSGSCGSTGDGGKATSAQLGGPYLLATDPSGNLYIADYFISKIRLVTKSTGIMTTVAGGGTGSSGCASCSYCDWYQCPNPSILATKANLDRTAAIALDPAGNMYITSGQMLFMVTKSTGIMTLLAGNYYSQGNTGDNGPASSALLNDPIGVAADASGNVYIADYMNGVVRKIIKSTGIIVTVAGINYGIRGSTQGSFVNGGFAYQAYLGCPIGLVMDTLGMIYFTDGCNNNVRTLTASTKPTYSPSTEPTTKPTTALPTMNPTLNPTTATPTFRPSTSTPSLSPTTFAPTYMPSTLAPTKSPTTVPSVTPTSSPSTSTPTTKPTTALPTTSPTLNPTTATPTLRPTSTFSPSTTATPTVTPTTEPTAKPSTASPSFTSSPTTLSPTITQKSIYAFAGSGARGDTTSPSLAPTTIAPTAKPTVVPSVAPTYSPTTAKPTTATPTCRPTPTFSPSSTSPSLAPTSPPSKYSSSITSFAYTGAMLTFTVPAGVTSVVISASGAQGGGGHGGCNTLGFGGVVNATFTVTAGQIL